MDTPAHHRAHVTQRAGTHVCSHQQQTHITRDIIHSFIQVSHSSTHGTSTRSATRNPTRTLHSRLFSSLCLSTLCSPLLLCASALSSCPCSCLARTRTVSKCPLPLCLVGCVVLVTSCGSVLSLPCRSPCCGLYWTRTWAMRRLSRTTHGWIGTCWRRCLVGAWLVLSLPGPRLRTPLLRPSPLFFDDYMYADGW